MSKLKVNISGRVLVNNSASETPLKRSTFLLTLKLSVIFSCFPLDFTGFSFGFGFGLAADFLGSVDLFLLFLPLTVAERQESSYLIVKAE